MTLILKKEIRFFLIPALLILALLFSQFVLNTKYTFPAPHVFRGDSLYNPYRDMDAKRWKIANLHAHTKAYLGLTDGSANHDDSLVRYYKYFNYNIIGISNYQSISETEGSNKWYIPEYEHGFQYYKNHQLVLNAKKVSWLDYFFRQTLDNKQYIIDNLKKDSSVLLAIVHPDKRKAYSLSDFRYLGNYDCLEIADNETVYTSYYDTILSTGHPVFLLADDDTHNLNKPNDACQAFNVINTSLDRDSILQAIKRGCLFCVRLKSYEDMTNEKKRSTILKLPGITGIKVRSDTITVSLDQDVNTIRFIGQNGTEKKRIINSNTGFYYFNPTDTYIRTEIECTDGTVYYLNPVFRYNGMKIYDDPPEENILRTWAWRLLIIALTGTLLVAVISHRVRLKLR